MRPYYACNALTSLGFSIAAYHNVDTASRINAMYASSRSIAIVAICIVPFVNRSNSWLIAAATIMVIVQALDTLVGVKTIDKLKTFGLAITAIINLLALIWFVK